MTFTSNGENQTFENTTLAEEEEEAPAVELVIEKSSYNNRISRNEENYIPSENLELSFDVVSMAVPTSGGVLGLWLSVLLSSYLLVSCL